MEGGTLERRMQSERGMKRLLLRLLSGVAAGAAATGVMSLAMLGAQRAGLLGEPPPRRLTRIVLSPLGPLRPRGRALDAAALVAHFGFGAGLGALFSLLPVRARSRFGGTLFGGVAWAVNYAGWLPRLGLMPPPSRDRPGRPSSMLAAHLVFGASLAVLHRKLWSAPEELQGKVVVVCGGTRGLGRALARRLLDVGAHVAICGRSRESLEHTRSWLQSGGGSVIAQVCDLRLEDQTRAFFERVRRELGPIDVVVANAATIDVGPVEELTPDDVDAVMTEIFGSAVRATLTALPEMQARGRGSLVFISSIGGRLGVPHLAAYSAAKFAEVGFAEALRAEVARDGVHVLTVAPGLMRTGSHLRARFHGDAERELLWFGASAIMPGVSIDADRAASLIVRAIAQRERFLTFTLAARLGLWLHDRFPSAWAGLAALGGRLLPRAANGASASSREGQELAESSSSRLVGLLASASQPLAVKHGQ